MNKVEKRTFSRSIVVLDGTIYSECTFDQCRIFYTGGDYALLGCNFLPNCSWGFQGSAERTIELLKLGGAINEDALRKGPPPGTFGMIQ